MESESQPPLIDASSSESRAEPEGRAVKARKTRMQNSTPSQRRTVARKAAHARWGGAGEFAASRKRQKRSGRSTSAVFGKALAAAETRLTTAIQERAEHASIGAYHTSMVAALDAEIPSLVKAIRALKNTQEPQVPASAVSPAAQLASAVRLAASPVRAIAQVEALSEDQDEDEFLKESEVFGGGPWR